MAPSARLLAHVHQAALNSRSDGRVGPRPNGGVALAPACDDLHVVEYGNGVSGVAGQVSGGSGATGRSIDFGAQAGQFVTDSVQMLSSLPPAGLLALAVVAFLGLLLLKRAF